MFELIYSTLLFPLLSSFALALGASDCLAQKVAQIIDAVSFKGAMVPDEMMASRKMTIVLDVPMEDLFMKGCAIIQGIHVAGCIIYFSLLF